MPARNAHQSRRDRSNARKPAGTSRTPRANAIAWNRSPISPGNVSRFASLTTRMRSASPSVAPSSISTGNPLARRNWPCGA